MNGQWHYQLRVYLTDAVAEMARSNIGNPALVPLKEVLIKHNATMRSQLDAFEGYVAEAEREGPEQFPLYNWTKATLKDPDKRRKHATTLALHVSGKEVYSKEEADRLEADLKGLVGGELVVRISKHDTDPANNLPVPSEHRA